MSDKPILFSRPMIQALLDGRKTQTRRALKPKRHSCLISDGWDDSYVLDPGNAEWLAKYLRFSKGDRLWVKETWRIDDYDDKETIYAADIPDDVIRETKGIIKSRPSIFMPRNRSRLTLIVTGVKVERLQDISADDAIAEGIDTDAWDMAPVARRYGFDDAWFVGWPMGVIEPSVSVDVQDVARCSYQSLWNSINGAGAWEANPFVAVYGFEVHKCNIDALEAKS